ncbi:MAG: Lrp/AsnC family transcriptional regulator [Methanomicrobiaceae archaeon]|nr:Lrp/AsnC family transcriptional regulator [Methanomicrobiaceae archaeon]
MDERDKLLCTLLEENSRISTRDLSEMVDLLEDEVEKRIGELEKEGIIRKYITLIDWEKAGDGGVAAIIEVKVSPERDFGYDKIAERLARFKQVRSLHLISGVYDLQMLVTGKTIHEISRFVSEQIAPMDHIRETATTLIMKTYKENGHAFTEREGGERLPLSF